MRVSLIVTTYNWPAALHLSLTSVARQTVMPTDVIVADDGSGTATADVVNHWIASMPCPVRHVWQEDRGFRLARSRNRALAASDNEYIVLIDGDMILHRKFIEDHVSAARPDRFVQGARPQLSAALTAKLLQQGSSRCSFLTRGVNRRAYALRSSLLSRWTSKTKSTLAGIQGCNQSFWREHVVKVNGYDERFTGWGPEDREFAARLLHIGVKRHYLRHRAIAFHLHHPTRAPQGRNPFDALLEDTLRTRAERCLQGLQLHSTE